MKTADRYPKEKFDRKQQLEWARAVVDRLYSYSAAAEHSTTQDSGSSDK